MPLYDPPLTAAEILALLLTVDGAGSTLDADTLDGISSAGFDAAGAAAAAQAASQPLDADLTTIAGLTATTDNMIQSVAGAWASRTPAQVKTALVLPFTLSLLAGANVGAVTTSLTYLSGGGATAGIGIVIGKACHLTRMAINFNANGVTTSGAVTVVFTLFKNANSGTSNRVFQITFTALTTGTGRAGASTTIVDATMDAINGTTDYLVLAAQVTASTSCQPALVNMILEGTYD